MKPLIEECKIEQVSLDNLKKVNESLWDIEDNIRNKELKSLFDNEFIDCIKDVNEIDPISVIKETLLQQIKLGD